MPFPISLDEIERAYAETGLRPIEEEWVEISGDSPSGCCPLAAVYIHKVGFSERLLSDDNDVVLFTIALALDLKTSQVTDFVRGFDRHGIGNVRDFVAYEAGKSARVRFLPSKEG